MLFHGMKLFFKQCRLNVKFTILTMICLISSFWALIFLFERGYSQYVVDADTEQETQVLYLSSDETTIKDIFCKIAEDPLLPKLKQATVSGSVYSGLFWSTEAGEYYTPYGRFFREDEISTDAEVALIGTGYLSLFSHDEIDSILCDGIKINDVTFEVIGTYNYNWGDGSSIPPDAFCYSPMPNAITVPIHTFFDRGLTATKMRCVFSTPLTEEQHTYLTNFLESSHDLRDVVIPKTEKMNRKIMLTRMLENVAPFALIVFLSVINIANIVMYWLYMEFRRFQIYRICGSNSRMIVFLISVQVALLVFTGFLGSCAAQEWIRVCSPTGVIARMPVFFYLIILAVQLFAMILLVLMKSMRLIQSKNLAQFND